MTNFKKIGLTALAGTLAATAYAQAGALSVSGTARMEYQSTQASATAKSDAFAQNTTISFTGSGELDNGMTVSYLQAQAGSNVLTSQGVTLDMGDMGSVAITNYNFGGIGIIQDKVPNGGEQPWDDLGTHGAPEQGIAAPHAGNRLGYKNTFGGATVSASMDYQQNSPTTSLAVSMPLMEGLEIGAGIATDQDSATTEQDIETMYVKYSMGGISVGYQVTDVERTAANSDIERTAYGISFAVNDNLSVGYGISDTEFEEFTPDEENTGIGIAYTSGGMKLGIINNTKDNAGGTAGEQEMTEFQLTFAF
ncbi:putative porin [Candidatus Pelagibacter sp. HTCC7211]|uniref:porin n=1 Tax=Pelagibacter sp. (strain HTCC7211) TaxID=439493 RepID=UPI00018393EA|nr:porin [Candidatus Pelagibacter sp. HTCC7211]EDZ60146.1 putative porin [Candidatus Pelagibacter sp. HTCC7211]